MALLFNRRGDAPMDGRCRKVQTLSLVLIKFQFTRASIIITEVNSISSMSSHLSDKTQAQWSEQYEWLQFTVEQEMACKTC